MVTEAGFAQDIKPNAIVLSRPDELSGVLFASIALAPARESLPKTRIFLLIREKFAALFVNHPQLDGIFTIAPDTSVEELASDFKKQKIDTLAHLAFSPLVAEAAKLAGIKNTVAFEKESAGTATLEILDSVFHRTTHEAFYNFEVLAPFGVKSPARPFFDLAVHKSAKKEVFEKIQKYNLESDSDYAVFCLDCNLQGHAVAASVFANAAGWLTRNKNLPIIVLGDPQKSAGFLNFCRASHGAHILDMRGKTTSAEDAWILAGARFCLSGENACAYLAAAMKCPLIALFVDFSSGRWLSLGYLSTNIFTGAQRFPLEPKCLYNWRASRAFQLAKLVPALKFSLALKE